MSNREAYDRLVEEKLDRALAPWADKLPPEVLAAFRDQLEDFMTTHPVMERMLEQLLPAPVVGVSGEVARDADGEQRDEGESRHGTGGRK